MKFCLLRSATTQAACNRAILLATALSCSQGVQATEAIIIGGGTDIQTSSEHLEANVQWIQYALEGQSIPVSTYFNDGNSELADMRYRLPDARSLSALERVFEQPEWHLQHYRQHTVESITDGTQLETLKPALKDLINKPTDEPLLVVYSGLGKRSDDNQSSHATETDSLHLWGNTQLPLSDLRSLFDQSQRPIRFVMSQCNSGVFHSLSSKDTPSVTGTNDPVHCGFTASSAYGDAELCHVDQITTDYRDYASYFFSAFTGYEYDGEIVSRFADTNEDGQVSLREAHLYTLQESRGIDMPVSSSESYLLDWQPWYLRWMPAPKQLPENDYTRLFRELARGMNLTLDRDAAQLIRNKLTNSISSATHLHSQLSQVRETMSELQTFLQKRVSAHWPSLNHPYSPAYQEFITQENLADVNRYIQQLEPQYSALVQAQEAVLLKRRELMDANRLVTQYRKLFQLRRLATLNQQLHSYGKAEQVAAYRSLLACEKEPISPQPPADRILSEDSTQ